MSLYWYSNTEIITEVMRREGLTTGFFGDILSFRVVRDRGVVAHDDGREWPTPEGWSLA